MTTPTRKPTAKKMPGVKVKPRIMYACYMLGRIYAIEHTWLEAAYHLDGLADFQRHKDDGVFPVLVLPQPSLQSARKRLKWERMTEEEKVARFAEELAKAQGHPWGGCGDAPGHIHRNAARSLLRLMGHTMPVSGKDKEGEGHE